MSRVLSALPLGWVGMVPSPQIFLFTGENTYAVREEKKKWQREFTKKHGAENCVLLPSTTDFHALIDEVSASPFIAEKRLVIVEGIPKGTAEDVEQLPSVIHPDCILVFVEAAPDKRLSTVKNLLKTATVKEFPHLQGKPLRVWLNDTAKREGKQFDADALERLVLTVGEDEDQLIHEVEKIVLGTKGSHVALADVVRLAVPGGDQEVWLLTSLLVRGDPAPALTAVRELLMRGEDPQSIWNILLWFLRQVASVAAGIASGEKTAPGLQQKLQVPFPTAKTLLPVANSIDLEKLRAVLAQAINDDRGLKTGVYRSSHDAQQEVLALLDRLVMNVSLLFSPTTRSA